MLHADRWAARYGFLRELWAGRSRVLADPALEAALRGAKALPAPFAALLAELLPGGGNQAWLLAHEARPGTGRGRTGPRVAEFDAFEELLAEAPWQVAIVDLARHFVDTASLSRFAARAQSRLENRLETRAFRLLTALAEGAEAGRVVVVSAPGEAAGGLELGLFQELVTQHFPRARIYALALTRAASVIDCGEVTSDEVEDEEADDRGPVPLAFDNSLGEDVGFECLIAVVGARDVPRGVTLLELPPTGAPAEPPPRPERARPERARDEESESLRGQLAQARRQIELASIARQSLVEQLDAAQGRIDALEDQLAGRAPAPAKASEPDEEGPQRIDAAAAALQSARWELEQLQGELRRVTARPVDELERSLAAAQARLGALHACAAQADALAQRAGADEALAGELQTLRDRLLELAGPPVSPTDGAA
ncbi:hypothetical protein [Nannocystis punicea]|uniref:Uncharacterized protein n=1 Tax=Nannocystis punicea TaxID=2995304 RepID=A0ABY7HKB4_9BACT|nr:hypothetical protein [Nannocystis poenicansa]WAS99470.1 hypothetical protein O0S08_25375 [Nannocystis poenicansa]